MIDPTELHAFVDGQLDKADRKRVEGQLAIDPDSQAQVESIRSLKAFVSNHCAPVECQQEWVQCVARLDGLDKAKRTENFVGRYAWAMCGVFFVAILVGGVISRNNPGRGDESTDIARVVASMSPTGAPSTKEPAAMRKWLDDLVGQAAASVSPERLDIVSASTGELDGARAAKLVLRDRDGEMTLVMVNANVNFSADSEGASFERGQLQGINCIVWHDHLNTLVLAGDRSYDDLIRIATDKIVR